MTDALDLLLQASFWAATVRIATPLILGTLGELLCERAPIGTEALSDVGQAVAVHE